ncbi:hypothetical protein GCM10027413_24900 [Conyzicola nivalis]|uniref:Uncharacterized protein n=1 Tax=Conyzicola nivalis TaxID=1477021 RepID=A0A916SCC6_9MICO|nr:hypothetical protein [Conyzicola nivalis]GGA90681.1 hypothetical protein GCM10010979_01720 [Conyzicola nivalis]
MKFFAEANPVHAMVWTCRNSMVAHPESDLRLPTNPALFGESINTCAIFSSDPARHPASHTGKFTYDALDPGSPQIIEIAGEVTSAIPTAAGIEGAEPDFVIYGDPAAVQFSNKNLWGTKSTRAINGFVIPVTPGDDPIVKLLGPGVGIISAQSVHPNKIGTSAYAATMEFALGWF